MKRNLKFIIAAIIIATITIGIKAFWELAKEMKIGIIQHHMEQGEQ